MVGVPRTTDTSHHEQAKYNFDEIGGPDVQRFLSSPSTVIVNVLSANADFLTCKSTRFSQEMDKLGERTVAVVTELEQAPNGIHSKVMEMAKGMCMENLECCFLRYVLVNAQVQLQKMQFLLQAIDTPYVAMHTSDRGAHIACYCTIFRRCIRRC